MTSSGYVIEVDTATPAQWSQALPAFADASLYQTWAYGAVRWGRGRTSHLIVTRYGTVAAMAQLAVVQPLGMRIGVAQLRWGPVWHRKSEAPDPGVAQVVVDALHAEYVERRHLHLRVLPGLSSHVAYSPVLQQALAKRFTRRSFDASESFRTVLVDLRQDLDAIRRRLAQKWRNQLNRAERNGLTIVTEDGPDAFSRFGAIYEQMLSRKGFVAPGVASFQRMQAMLPEDQRLKVFVCEENGQPVAGIVVASVGSTGVYLLGASNELGMRCKGAYLLQWRAIESLKRDGVEQYDLGGINPERNPGVAHFKEGFGGAVWDYLPPFTACTSAASKFAADTLQTVRRLRTRPGAAQPVTSSP